MRRWLFSVVAVLMLDLLSGSSVRAVSFGPPATYILPGTPGPLFFSETPKDTTKKIKKREIHLLGSSGQDGVRSTSGGGPPTYLGPPATIGGSGDDLSGINGADFDGDGMSDMVTVGSVPGVPDPARRVRLLHGNFDETYTPLSFFDIEYGWEPSTADMDGDGHADLVLTTGAAVGDSGEVVVLLGNGDGTFGPPQRTKVCPGRPTGLAVGDVDGDGRPDLVVCSDGKLLVLHGNPGGTVTLVQEISEPGTPATPVITGPDASGRRRVVHSGLGSSGQDGVGISEVLSDGSLGANIAVGVTGSSGAKGVVVADLDDDGPLDLVCALDSPSGVDGVAYCLGRLDGTFGPWTLLNTGANPVALVADDQDGDGLDDLLILNQGSATITVYRQLPGTTAVKLSGLSANGEADGAVRVGWTAFDAMGGSAVVMRSRVSGGMPEVVSAALPIAEALQDMEFIDHGTRPGAEYFYSVRLTHGGATIEAGPVRVRTAAPPLSLAPISPNPARGAMAVRFTVPARGRAVVSLYSVSGRLVQVVSDSERDAGAYSTSIDASKLAAGMYFVRVRQGGRTAEQRITVLK